MDIVLRFKPTKTTLVFCWLRRKIYKPHLLNQLALCLLVWDVKGREKTRGRIDLLLSVLFLLIFQFLPIWCHYSDIVMGDSIKKKTTKQETKK